MWAFAVSLLLAVVWTAWRAVGRPAARHRRSTRLIARPQPQIVTLDTVAAEVAPIVARAGQQLTTAGFTMFAVGRVRLGTWGGQDVCRWNVVWLRPQSYDRATIEWQQVMSGRRGASVPSAALHFDRRLAAGGQWSQKYRLAEPEAGGGGRLTWTPDVDDLGAAYADFAAAPQAGPALPWPYGDAAAYAAAWGEAATTYLTSWLAGQARLDAATGTYVYTWRAAVSDVYRHRFGRRRPAPAARGFEVLPVALRPAAR